MAADTSSLSSTFVSLEDTGIPARFGRLLTEAHDSAFERISVRAIEHPGAGVVVAELRSFDSFASLFESVSTQLITYFRKERDAPTTKIAASLALKAIAQSTLNRISVTYLMSGRAPRMEELRFRLLTKAPWVEVYYDPRLSLEDVQLDPDQGPSEIFELSICIDQLIELLHHHLGQRKVPPAVFYSSIAIALTSPFLVLRRHGAKHTHVAAVMRAYLASLGKKIDGGMVWRQRVHNGVTEYAPRRKACCLKYALPSKPHLCSTCSRRTETTFFDDLDGLVGGHTLEDGR